MQQESNGKNLFWGFAMGLILTGLAPFGWAEEGSLPVEEVTVEAVKEMDRGPLAPAVSGTSIYAGKKVTQVALGRIPTVYNNNYRQAFGQLPGLLVSEVNDHGIVNINYRGIGDPHESQDLLTLKDGLPIGMDRIGYSTSYYTPPMESVERIELIRGGGALLYGPQPGPVLNYVTYDPPQKEGWGVSTSHTFGSFGTYRTFQRGSISHGPWGLLAYQYHTHSNGPRANEGFDINGGNFKLAYHLDNGDRWLLGFDAHRSEAREPGRLTLAQYRSDRRQVPRPGDRLDVARYAAYLRYDGEPSDATKTSLVFYGNFFDRFSLRRTTNTSTQNNLDRRTAHVGGVEGRLRHDFAAFGQTHTMTLGGTFYANDAPRTQDRSAPGTYPSENGNPIFDFDYRTLYGALFGEIRWILGNLSIVPGFRLDLVGQRVKENFNKGKTSPLHNINEFSAVPLMGLGLEYAFVANSSLYANISQGYKPPQFDDLAPTGNNTLPATSLDPGKTWTFELGAKGHPINGWTFDLSLFRTIYDNFFGTVTVGSFTQRQNVGKAIYQGADLLAELDLIRLVFPQETALGSLSLYGNVSLLDAEFDEGPLAGREPAYAPAYLAKAGLVYRKSDWVKLALMGTWVEDHYWADNNQAAGVGLTAIPSYGVWDLTAEFRPLRHLKVVAGINNLTDEIYFSRVRSDGIEPALRRNYYAGLTLEW